MLQNDYLLAKIGFDPAENEPRKELCVVAKHHEVDRNVATSSTRLSRSAASLLGSLQERINLLSKFLPEDNELMIQRSHECLKCTSTGSVGLYIMCMS